MSRRKRRRLLALAAGRGLECLDRVLDEVEDATARHVDAVADLTSDIASRSHDR